MGVNIVGKIFLGLGSLLIVFAVYKGFTAGNPVDAAIEGIGDAAKGLKAVNTTSGKFKVNDDEVLVFGHEIPNNIAVYTTCSKGDACPTIAIKDNDGVTLDCSKDGPNGGCRAGDCSKCFAHNQGDVPICAVRVCAVYGIRKGDYTFEASTRVTILSKGAIAQAGSKAFMKGGESLMNVLMTMLAGGAGILTLVFTGICMACFGCCTTPEKSASAREHFLTPEDKAACGLDTA